MVCYCFLRCIVDILADGKTAYFNRFGIDFPGPKIAFGAEVRYKPASPKGQEGIHKFGDKMLPGIFLGYDQHAGGGWSGDLLIANQEEIAQAESVSDIYIRRVPQREMEVRSISNDFVFPLAKGNLSQPVGGVKEKSLRRRRLRTIQEEEEKVQDEGGETDDSIEVSDSGVESSLDGEPFKETEAEDFWSMTGDLLIRVHKTPRISLFNPDRTDIPLPLKFLDI